MWLYNLTEFSNRSQDLRAVFSSIGKADIRIQALIVAYTFCNLLEGLAGFGAPVAITCAMLATLGLPKIRAVLLCLLGNLVYLAYGAMATPVLTAGRSGRRGSCPHFSTYGTPDCPLGTGGPIFTAAYA